ncbi:MAG: biotin/lipoyl-containing protein, partial [Pseudomonadota bacterium]
ARAAFGDDALILERALDDALHVEVQVLADAHGTVLTLGERDCSVQRRRQKVLEEAPAPGLSEATREALAEAARRLAVAGGYANAGTAEFLVSPAGEVFFLEMNARLQVEHPVTEAVTGRDLVALQLRAAQGRPLGLRQEDVRLSGHAVEARLCAEDPAAGFLPSAGPIRRWRMPEGEGLRVDAGYGEGGEVPAVYDSLLAKVIAHGATREEALARLSAALRRAAVVGPRTNAAFLTEALAHPEFALGGVSTLWLERTFDAPVEAAPTETEAAVAAALWLAGAQAEALAAAVRVSPGLLGWASDGGHAARVSLRAGEQVWEASARAEGADLWRVTMEGETEVRIEALEDGAARLRVDGKRREVVFFRRKDGLDLAFGPRQLGFSRVVPGAAAAEETAGGRLTAPMHGRLTALDVAEGDAVAKGAPVAVLEAMKMQHRLTAPVAGRVARVAAAPGAQVAVGDLLLEIEEEERA